MLLCVTSVQASVVIGGTRFIYQQKQPSISFRVLNQEQLNYLVVTKVQPDDGTRTVGTTTLIPAVKTVPFIANPPLFVVKANKEGMVRIMKTGGDDLPRDRESLFWLSIASIPESAGKPGQNQLQVAVRAHMKLIYRPDGLKGKPDTAYSQLKWSRKASEVSVTNPTPWYVTLVHLQSNGQEMPEPGMVAPFSTRVQPWCPEKGNCQLQWQTLNDYGALMPPLRITVN